MSQFEIGTNLRNKTISVIVDFSFPDDGGGTHDLLHFENNTTDYIEGVGKDGRLFDGLVKGYGLFNSISNNGTYIFTIPNDKDYIISKLSVTGNVINIPTTTYDLTNLHLNYGTYNIKVVANNPDSEYEDSDDSNIVQYIIEAPNTSANIYDFTGQNKILTLTPANKQYAELKTDGIYFNNERVYEIYNYKGLANSANSTTIGNDVNNKVLSIGSSNLQLSNNETNTNYYIIPSYTLTYNTNQGILQTGFDNPTIDVVKLPSVLPTCSKENYTFEGWYYNSILTNKANANDLLTDNTTLYAKYSPIQYSINYILNGGTNPTENPTLYTIEDLPITLLNPIKEGYAGQWLDNETNITTITVDNIGNKELIAKYTTIIYEIIYNLDGGTNNQNNPISYTIETPTITLLNPIKEGYIFNGWYKEPEFINKVEQIEKGTIGNLELYAKWELKTYSITYTTFGGTLETGFDNPTLNVTNLPETLPICTKYRANFLGWYYDINYINKANANDKLTTDVVLYAKYETAYVSFDRHFIPEKIRLWSYYLEKLPLYLQNSFGFNDHFYILFELLCQIESTSADLIRGLDLFDETKLNEHDTYSNYLLEFSDDLYKFDLLDKLASVYNVARTFDVNYVVEGELKNYSLKLTNYELLILILAKAILSSFDGTYSSARELYNKINLPIYIYTQDVATVYLILDKTISKPTDNIIHMFNAGMFNLKSMGIAYTTTIADISKFALWDEGKFDEGLWS